MRTEEIPSQSVMAVVLNQEHSLSLQVVRLRKEKRILRRYVIPLEAGGGVVLLGAWLLFGVPFLFGVSLLLLAGAGLYRFRSLDDEIEILGKGKWGEDFVLDNLRTHLSNDYSIANDVTLRAGGETAQIDHLVFSAQGIFVIETKNYAGMMEGAVRDRKVRVTRSGRVKYVTNPVSQNRRHCRVLRTFLRRRGISLPEDNLVSVIIMANHRIDWKISGFTGQLGLWEQAVDYIVNYRPRASLTRETVQRCIDEIFRARDAENSLIPSVFRRLVRPFHQY